MKCPQCDFDNPSGTRFCGNCGSSLYPSEKVSTPPAETLRMPLKELATGSIFARRYEVIEELGKGGMGRVYKVFDKKIKEKVALKLLRLEISSDEETVERFSNELKYARKIIHKNVCRMFDLGEEEGTHYITMEYVSGEDLKSMIRMMGRMSPGQAVSITRQVCEGLAEAHKLGVVHRDLKPQNIMIDREGNARIMDFGIARSLKAKGITDGGIIIGTPEYMSPEQVEGKEIDQRADIYALGVILYEMLIGRVPFEGDTPLSIAVKHKTEAPQDPRTLNAQLPLDLSQLILKCLEKDKKKRPQSAEEILSQLSKIEQEVPAAERVLPQRKPFTSREIKGALGKRWGLIAALLFVAIAAGLVFIFLRKEKPALPPANKRIVVLPFENQGALEDEYFADGMTDEITARLSSISRLEVIARTSAYQYKKTSKTPQKIGDELSVGYILYGTVRWQKQPGGASKVRVTPSLVRISDATQIWANPYDETIAEVFQVQADIAKRVAEALNIALLEPEQKVMEAKLTNNPEAYDYYLRGMDSFRLGADNRKNLTSSIEMLEKAVKLDPSFAQAYAGLARAHATMYWFHLDHTEERSARSKEAADKALQLGPNIPEAHLALGFYYYSCKLDYEHSLEHLSFALKKQPRNSEILEYIAYVKRRQGKLDENLSNLNKALEINPRDVNIIRNLGNTYFLSRNYIEGERLYKGAISIFPDYISPYIAPFVSIGFLYLSWEGNTKKAREILEEATQRIVSPDDKNGAHFLRVIVDIYDKEYQSALKHISLMPLEALDNQFHFVPKSQLYAQIYGLIGEKEKEKEYYGSARLFLENKAKEQPDDSRFHSALGIAYAGLGLKEKAVQEAIRATELLPISKEFFRGPYRVKDLARVYVMIGEYDKALDKIEYLLSIPGELSIPLLKIDPVWTPLRNLPRFQKLLKR
jgi:serine/threonine protein kinase/Tfp pilus assembly protein PilF